MTYSIIIYCCQDTGVKAGSKRRDWLKMKPEQSMKMIFINFSEENAILLVFLSFDALLPCTY